MPKQWGGRFAGQPDSGASRLGVSVYFDCRLALYDIEGSAAHAAMLETCGVISSSEAAAIMDGLSEIGSEIRTGTFQFDPLLEDVHTAIEAALIARIGPVGGKLHTGRSRNDQVALSTRLYLRSELAVLQELLARLQTALVDSAAAHIDLVMPGYTHTQRAQPVRLAHHLLAYHEMLVRDRARLDDCAQRADSCPLGAGALAGTTFPIDRFMTAHSLGFARVACNSMDAVSDRDFIIEFLSDSAILMMHLSRLAEDLILWSTQEFNFLAVDDAFCTGSSIMPQKKNPDVLELIRGKCGRVYGSLMALLTVMKGLPLSYNRDMQEDKEPLFDTVDTLTMVLPPLTGLISTVRFNATKMKNATAAGFLNATDAADYLASKGLPFREAHKIIGEIVVYCINRQKTLDELEPVEWQAFSPLFSEDIRGCIDIMACVDRRNTYGGPSREQVMARIADAREKHGGALKS